MSCILFMEEEDISGTHAGHDPHQPAHVCRPGPELPQVQPAHNSNIKYNLTTNKRLLTLEHSPGGVRGSDEEINHHPVAHM